MGGIPYYRQGKEWNCGAAAMRMVLQALGFRKSEKELARLLGTSKKSGTRNKAFAELGEKLKLNYCVKRKSSLKELEKMLDEGWLVILGYFLEKEKEGHYAVVEKISKGKIFLLDPKLGKGTNYSLKHFGRIWKNNPKGKDKEKKWLIAFKK